MKIGFLLDSFMIHAWSYEAIKKALEIKNLNPCVIIVKKHNNFPKHQNIKLKLKKLLRGDNFFETIGNALYYRYAEWDKAHYISKQIDAHQLIDIRNLINNVSIIEVSPRETKFCDWIEGEDIDKISSYQPDILFRLGFRILKGSILEIPKHGVWSYHHGDPEKYKGGPSGFWETYYNEMVGGSVLQILNDRLDAGKMLARVISPVSNESPAITRNIIAWDSVELLKICIKKLLINEDPVLNPETNICTAGTIYKTPTTWPTICMGLKFVYRKIINNSRIFNQHWSIFLSNRCFKADFPSAIPILYDQNNFQKIKAPKGKFWADPFIIKWQDKDYLFFEEYCYNQKKGIIKVGEINGGKLKNNVLALESDTHLSNPFVFIENEHLYLLPEQSGAQEISIYKSIAFPYKWQKIITILKGGYYVDPILFKKDDVWWLFFVEKVSQNGSTTTYAKLFFANNLEGSWEEHPYNPISTDCRYSRSAGGPIITTDGKIIRPVQDCSQGYGYKINYLEIIKISKTEYKDRKIEGYSPSKLKLNGIHTVNFIDNILAIDGRKKSFRCLVE